MTSVRALEKAPLRASAETPNPTDLLAKIGRNAEKRLAAQAESWEGLSEVWQKGGKAMAGAGLSVKDRRYILWAISRYSQGALPSEFVQAPKPAKKFRG